VIDLRVDLPRQVERLHIGVATVVDEARFVAVEHAVEAEREEFVVVRLLNCDFTFFRRQRVVHVKQVRLAVRVVICAAHVSLLLRDDFTSVFHQVGSRRNLLHRIQTPHAERLGLFVRGGHAVVFHTGFTAAAEDAA